MLIIARISRRLRLNLPVPKSIIVSAETLLPEHKHEIEDAFRCKVFNQYSSSEPSCFWCDCEYSVMHQNPEYSIIEIVDTYGNPVNDGEPGEVITTSLLNTSMMLIRYKLGDVAIRSSSSSCKCGRTMPVVTKVEGRVEDIVFVPARGYVGRLDPSFKGLSNIIEAQIVQEELNHIRVLLVPDDGYNDDIEHHLIDNLCAKLGSEVKISVDKVHRIPRGPNGKFKAVVSKVKHLYPDKM